MATRTNPVHDAKRRALWLNQHIGRELRLSRHSAGMTQQQVAEILQTTHSEISRREHGLVRTLSLVQLSVHAAVVGLKAAVNLYPAVRRPMDRRQIELLGKLRHRMGPWWHWTFEVPMPIAGDLRAGDAVIVAGSCRCLVEALTRFADYQAQIRAAQLKKRDLGVDRLLLLVAGTRTNRAVMRGAEPMLRESFPVGTRRALRTMAEGQDPGGDALIVL